MHLYAMNPLRGVIRSVSSHIHRAQLVAALVAGLGASFAPAQAQVPLADSPLFSTTNVPGNLVLALSVEFPTAVTAADRSTTYVPATTYLGYFDPTKCYTYVYNEVGNGSYFNPTGTATAHVCGSAWSGNFMNWATMQAVDPFRWALTGGYRDVDTATMTILEKATAPTNQGNPGNNFPHKSLSTVTQVSGATPFSGSTFNMQVLYCGNRMLFRRDSTAFTTSVETAGCPGATAWDGVANATNVTYSVQARVRVCASAANRESNCVQYGSNYKPEGLIQQYASKIRYSAFGYLNDPLPDGGSKLRDGGVLRARMKFVGPTQPVPGSSPISNVVGAVTGQITSAEWSATTGVFVQNPDPSDATASSEVGSTITTSGVINYLNKFGKTAGAYKRYDPVSELYYAATRYLRNLVDVPEYSDLSRFNNGVSTLANRTAMKDGFPVIRNWTDPILYSCQKNFVLGIGDTNTQQDKSVPRNTTYRNDEPAALPSAVSSDTINAVEATNKVGVIEGMTGAIGETNQYKPSATNRNSAYIAGMAYLFNTTDIRADMPDRQSISTYWLDVLEGSDYKAGPAGRNQFYLAAKYGGFTVPTGYSYATNTTALPTAWWSTTGDNTLPIPAANSPRPDNYFLANQADRMVTGLSSAFSRIVAASAAYTTSFSTSLPQVSQTNNGSFSALYDPATWSGDIIASILNFDLTTGVPTLQVPAQWNFASRLATQVATTGWNTNRRVVTWNGSAGVAFRTASIANSDLLALNPTYVAGDDSSNYLNYLRGDQSNEAGVAGGTQSYRRRTRLVGDIVGSQVTPVGKPAFPFLDSTNPGYAAFKTTWTNRRTMVYVGANDGMLHAINGALLTTAPGTPSTPPLEVDAAAGQEMFAYVPRALFQGPSATPAPSVNGLASLGNPSFTHHYMVNATPYVYDLDFARTPDAAGVPQTGTPNWRSMLIGGLGKGGRSYYALDVTDPVGMTAGGESGVASRVLWEFTHSTLGYGFGAPLVVKTAKYGWVAVLTSGYSNADGQGYFIFVNPRTGALLETVSTGVGSVGNDAGLAHANAFVVDATNGTADAIYAGDLLGNLWRLDVTRTTPGDYPAPRLIARLEDATGNAQPVTSAPALEIDPVTKRRVIMFGTGRLLDTTDIASTRQQTFYAIADGTNAAFITTPLSPAPAFPYNRTTLLPNSSPLTGLTIPANRAGWYEDLGVDATTGIGWRVVSDPTTFFGSVAWVAVLPSGDACNPSGRSRIYGRNYSTGHTTLLAPDGTGLIYSPRDGQVTNLRYTSVSINGTGRPKLVCGTDTGVLCEVPTSPPAGGVLRRLNWRELH